MSTTEQRNRKLFHHVHAAADLLEEILLSNPVRRENDGPAVAKIDRRTIDTTERPRSEKLAYTLKEVQELVGVSRSSIYLALADRRLRAVKLGKKTLVLAKELQEWLEKLPAKS